jgi:transcriptional regulator with XRE-family HTH domain
MSREHTIHNRLRALGDAIRAARTEKGYTQETLAKRAGLDRSYYGAVERGEFNLTIQTLLRISAGLGVPASALLRRAKL